MKKLYAFISFSLIVFISNATQWTVAVSSNAFTPAIVNAVCGDTIMWAWSSGSHTTTSTTIPTCATAWNANINSTSLTYTIVVPCAGTYNYKCTPHAFTGTLTVTCPSGVAPIVNNYFSVAYPTPFSSRLTIEFSNADLISLYNVIGEKIKTITVQQGQTKAEINSSDLKEGIYFYCILKEGVVIETRKIVKN